MLSLVFSSIKCAMTVQTVWRLPRTIISSSGPEGCLVFVILYTVFSFVWALPTLVLEGGIGRWNRKGVVNSFHEFIDTRATWCGVWIMACSFFTAGYLNVVVGWCLYYLYSSVVRPLPRTLNETEIIFDNFVTKEWKWNVFNSFVVCLCVVSSLIKGIWIIEMINTILAPIFIVLVVGIFALSAVNMTAMLDAMIFLFTPDITVATLPRVWWNAISQSSCASGAGYGVMLTYAIHQPRDFSIVKNSVGVIACVLITSLFIALTPLIAQFGERMNANVTAKMVIEQLRESDTSDLGLMFTSNYILLGKTGTVGRGVAMLFFTCLLCAGLRTLVGLGEVSVRVLIEAGGKVSSLFKGKQKSSF
ncbi:hypothetical protein LSAT2_014836 [Lamellibrachia satsuma]|nr:hypothetical protein LSAT2_014836 [Lamellibrachia satsuma]